MIRIGVAIMHHPRRADRIPALVRACAPLAPTVVTDPEPDGPPSPLRTAKQAWAAIDPDATHHLVLQDDVRLVPGFAEKLYQAVGGRPSHGVTLFTLWDTPHNSYLVRRTAVAGARYAPLSPYEWTPTQGFVLPTDHARDLADYLAEIPDDAQDDDEMVVIFCREREIPVVAAVPHLMDHGHDPSLVAGHNNGLHSTIRTPEDRLFAGDVLDGGSVELELPYGPYTVELRDSICSIRLLYGDPVEHQFPWYWYDACQLAQLDAESVLQAAEPYLSELLDGTSAPPSSVLTEVWAAGYMLGSDVADVAPATSNYGPLTSAALETWIDQGLSAQDHRSEGLRAQCIRLATSAVRQGIQDRKGRNAV